MQIQSFTVDSKQVKNQNFGIRDIIIFPLIVLGAPFLLFGFLFFSLIDKMTGSFEPDATPDSYTFKQEIDGVELTFIETSIPEHLLKESHLESEPYKVETKPQFAELNQALITSSYFQSPYGYLLGFKNNSASLSLFIVSKKGVQLIDLEGNDWTIENDDHHYSEHCTLKKWGDKESVLYTLKPNIG